ncbi:ankyrin repeat domain-containing protein [Candidatus Synchoanobacter obligatus]|uniref:Ankyrin repeat domain-containing protein n=1 Tax=Candidatus Synchoanobacter obligatus TaxID=2919597 RepID=A0ABT1L582_9GAMM|nr:ankyrin repeat domain-containing protein [Candidatus Synchoanobacter obligatus]MCP8352023.1 ankyrin repeat domain-containing protein [Candidatus Synchoanobacter obligatus]
MHSHKEILLEGSDLQKWSIVEQLSELDVSTLGLEDREFYQEHLSALKDNSIVQLHPFIGKINDILAILQPAVQQPGYEAMDVHSSSLRGLRKDGQDFLDANIVLSDAASVADVPNAVAIEAFNAVAEEIKVAIKESVESDGTMAIILPQYLDFLKEENKKTLETMGCRLSGAKTIWQTWKLCQISPPIIDKNMFFDTLFEAATAYEDSMYKYFDELDYSCHPGMEERIQMMVAQASLSMFAGGERSYSMLLADYVKQSFRYLSNSMDGDRRHGRVVALNKNIPPIIYDIALNNLGESDFVEKNYERSLTQREVLALYDKDSDGALVRKEAADVALPDRFKSSSALFKWYLSNQKNLPQKTETDIEFAEGKLDELTARVFNACIGVGDRWLLHLVFAEGVGSSKKALEEKIREFLNNERENLNASKPYPYEERVSEDYIEETIKSMDDCYAQMLKAVIKKLEDGEVVTLPTPISSAEITVIGQVYKEDCALLHNVLISGHSQLQEVMVPMCKDLPVEVLTARDDRGRNTLQLAMFMRSTDITNAILAREDLPDEVLTATSNYGYNALMFVVMFGYTDVANAILAREYLPDEVLTATKEDGYNALMIAVHSGYTDVVNAILSREDLPVEVLTARDDRGRNALLFAIFMRSADIANAILAREDLPDEVLTATSNYDYNTLMYAVIFGYTDVANAILAREYLPDEVLTATEEYGYNALMMAVHSGYTDVVNAILSRVDLPQEVLTATDDSGCNALTLAEIKGDKNIANAIKDYGARIEEGVPGKVVNSIRRVILLSAHAVYGVLPSIFNFVKPRPSEHKFPEDSPVRSESVDGATSQDVPEPPRHEGDDQGADLRKRGGSGKDDQRRDGWCRYL